MKVSSKLKSKLIIAGLGAAATLGPATATAQVSTSANGPYYATPSWDQKITTGRFVILTNWNNEAVLDRETGLVWDRTPPSDTLAWSSAQSVCVPKSIGGRKGWRLPSVQELATLIDPVTTVLPGGHPFVIGTVPEFWSSTTSVAAADGHLAWYMILNQAGNIATDAKFLALRAWCVRGGAGNETQ